jgi:hypothetical protein
VIRRPPTPSRALRLVALGLVAALAVALAACGGGSGTGSSTTTGEPRAGTGSGGGHKAGGGIAGGPGAPPAKRTAHPHHPKGNQGPPGSTMHRTYAGRIIGHELAAGGPVQPAELWPVTNGWRISDHRTLTAVYAGANPQRRSTGRLVIFRQNFVRVTQKSNRVDVPGSGPLTITKAPLGKTDQTAAQRNGTLQFRGANGTTGTLHLSNDSVTVDSS